MFVEADRDDFEDDTELYPQVLRRAGLVHGRRRCYIAVKTDGRYIAILSG